VDARQRQAVRRYVERLDRQRATLADEIADDVAQVQGLTMAERGEWIASACRAAFEPGHCSFRSTRAGLRGDLAPAREAAGRVRAGIVSDSVADPAELAVLVASLLEQAGVPYAIGGAIA